MKKLIYCTVLVVCFNTAHAQNAGINFNGSSPNVSAAFDIDVSALAGPKKGLLIPRVSATERNAMSPLPVPAQGLIVYQTDAVQGFYYNTSSTTIPSWLMLVENQSLRWDLLQNPQANLSLAHGDKTTDFTFNGITTTPALSVSSNSISSGSILHLASTSNDGGPGLTSKVLNLVRSGANTNSNHTSAGIYSTVSSTGTSSLNYAGFFKADGGTLNHAVHAETSTSNGVAVHATNSAAGLGDQMGVFARKTGNNALARGFGIAGVASGIADKNYGGYFEANGGATNYGVYSATSNDIGYASYAENTSGTTGAQHAVYGAKSGNIIGNGSGYAVRGAATGTAVFNYGGYFTAEGGSNNIGVNSEVTGTNATAIIGQNNSTTATVQVGIKGIKIGSTVTGSGIGVMGIAYNSASINTGGYFLADEATSNYGVHGKVSSGQSYGVYGENVSDAALYQSGVYGVKSGNMVPGGTGVGVFGRAYGTAGTNVGGEFIANGGTNNFAIWVPENSGKVVIGTDITATNSILAIKDGHIETQQTVLPIIAVNANAGTGASATVATFSSDVAGAVTVTTGSSAWAAGAQATVAFNKVYGNLPRVVIVATNANAAGKNYYVTSNISSFTINFTTAASSATQHTFNYVVMEN